MTFARGNPSNWSYNEELTSAQMNATDAQWPFAIDGKAGGSYAPTDWITFTGSKGTLYSSSGTCYIGNGGYLKIGNGSEVTGVAGSQWAGTFSYVSGQLLFDANSSLIMNAGTELVGTWTYNSASTVAINGALALIGANVTADATTTFLGTEGAKFSGTWRFDTLGAVYFAGSSIYLAGASATFEAGSAFDLEAGVLASVYAPIECSGNGRVNPTHGTVSSTTSYQGAAATMPSFVTLAPAGAMDFVLPSAGASVNQMVFLTALNANSAHAISVKVNTTPYVTMQNNGVNFFKLLLMWDGSTWQTLDAGITA